jgi:hypothetical protein
MWLYFLSFSAGLKWLTCPWNGNPDYYKMPLKVGLFKQIIKLQTIWYNFTGFIALK